jgi:Fic family protein
MQDRRVFAGLTAAVDDERRRLGPGGPRVRAETRRLALEEIWCSGRLAGARLGYDEAVALVERGIAVGERRLEEYILAADYAAAARYAAGAPLPGRRQSYLRLEEIVQLHTLAARREPLARPGEWRTTTVAPFPSGMVPPPAWQVPRGMNAFVERVALGPAEGVHPLLWVADAHERFSRIHPFAKGNGRVARLLANLLLRRVELPPFAVRGRAAERYLAALRRADSRDPWPLAAAFALAVLASLRRLVAANDAGDLHSLASFAQGAQRARLYKAAQRGRLRSVRRGGTLLTSAAWIAEYEASRAPRRSAL